MARRSIPIIIRGVYYLGRFNKNNFLLVNFSESSIL